MAANVVVSFLGDTKNLNSAFNQVQGQTTKTETAFGKLKRLGGPAMFGAAVAGVAVFKDALSGLRAEAEATRTLEATLKSMGRTEISTENIAKFASDLQANSDFVEEEIMAAAGVMATFGNIADRDLNKANQAAADLAARFNMDLGSATVMLGKALNDPIKGLTSLGRAGVQFTEQQKEQIARMVEVGDTAGAQGLILEELAKQTDGAAAAQQDSFERLQDVVGETAETFVGKLMPAIEATVGWITTAVTTFSEMDPAAQGVIFGITGITAALWLLHAHPIVAGLGLIIATLVFLEEKFGLVSGAARFVGDSFTILKEVAVTALQFMVDKFLAMVEWIARGAASIGEALGLPWAGTMRGAANEVEALRDAANIAFDSINTDSAKGEVAELDGTIRAVPGSKTTMMYADTSQATSALFDLKRLQDDIAASGTIGGGDFGGGRGFGRRQHGGPVSAGETYLVGEEGPELLRMPASGMVLANHDPLTQAVLGKDLRGVGAGLARTMADGVNSEAGSVAHALGRMAGDGLRRLLDELGIRSPSRVMDQAGRETGQGFVNGIDAMLGLVKNSFQGYVNAAREARAMIQAEDNSWVPRSFYSRGGSVQAEDGSRVPRSFYGGGRRERMVQAEDGSWVPESFYGGGRANGGSVLAGHAYTVGERGPETLIMGRQSGVVLPNSAGTPVVINLDGREIARTVMGHNDRYRQRGW